MLLKNVKIFTKGKFNNSDLTIENDVITSTEKTNKKGNTDYSGMYVIPGLVDIHTHGCVGYDFSSANANEIGLMQKYYLKNGITTIMATTVSLSDEDIMKAVDNIRNAATVNTGATIAGINLEGPYLSAKKCGAHDASLLKEPDINFIKSLGDIIKLVNVAPEYKNAFNFIKNFNGKVSIAHTACNYETANKAIELGADHITHIFNAMNGLHHRDPGVIGAFFESDAVAEMICDSIHIASPILKMMFKSYSDRIAVISDSMAATGLSDGNYKLGSLDVFVKNSVATLSDGTLAGSAMNLYKMMLNLISLGINPESVIKSVTEIPAESVGIGNECGKIEVGRKADLVILNSDFTIHSIIHNGTILDNMEL